MARVVDITNKLAFDGNPKLVVKGVELEVNADAATVLKLMGVLDDGTEGTPKQVMEMYNLIFSDATRKEIENLKLQFKDFQTLVENAISLVINEGEETTGEDPTRATI